MKDSLLWAWFWITLSNCKINNWLWGVEFAFRTLGCQSRAREGLSTMLGWPGSPAQAMPWSLGCGWAHCVYRQLRAGTGCKGPWGPEATLLPTLQVPCHVPISGGWVGGMVCVDLCWFVLVLFWVFWDTKSFWLNCITLLDGCLSSMRPPLQDTSGSHEKLQNLSSVFYGTSQEHFVSQWEAENFFFFRNINHSPCLFA